MRHFTMILLASTLLSSAAFADDISTLSGGIGEGDRAAIEAKLPDYGTEVVFSAEGGALVADVQVDVSDKAGSKLTSVHSEGPVLLLKLPEGAYSLQATTEGISKTLPITVGKGTHTYHIVFPITEDEDNAPHHPPKGDASLSFPVSEPVER